MKHTLLQDIARRAMIAQGFDPDWPAPAEAELSRLADPEQGFIDFAAAVM